MQINSRIKQRCDTLQNWLSNDIVLLSGELAVVDCGVQIRFKVGDGSSKFSQLKFIDEEQLSTQNVFTHAISQGTNAYSSSFGLAAGWRLSANANYSQAFGFKSQTLPSDDFSFVWNGDDDGYSILGDQYYSSHGKGTFNVNALSGLSGIYFGEQSLASILSSKQEIMYGTRAEWEADPSFVPNRGQIVVWKDKDTIVSNDVSTTVPGIKIGDGNAYNVDLPFAGDDIVFRLTETMRQMIAEHAALSTHITAQERETWNNKVAIQDVENETLVFTTN